MIMKKIPFGSPARCFVRCVLCRRQLLRWQRRAYTAPRQQEKLWKN